MQIAILGLGTIGSGVYKIIAGQTNQTKKLQVTHVLAKEDRPAMLPIETTDYDAILADPALDAVVETMGGIEPAHSYILKALAAHKHVVTANKAVVALYLRDFTEAAAANGVHFYYEATTGGGIPWLKNLENAARIDDIQSLSGIFNGTSNYILDQMAKTGEEFKTALASAQELGYAEKDPTADIDGLDVANKVRISGAIAFNTAPNFALPTVGIRNVSAQDIAWAKAHDLAIRLIGEAVRQHDRFAAVIAPTLVPQASLAAQCPDNFNLIRLDGPTIGELQFFGQGAGQLPTAHAIIQDLLDIALTVPHLERHFNRTLKNDAAMLRGDFIWRDGDTVEYLADRTVGELVIRQNEHPHASILRIGKEVNHESLQVRRVLDGQRQSIQ
ncbi:MAG: homoserine dehydrogenase [Lactobacillus sp.]|jgi:homoserine dehydrogenase|nr:homoserine dehydrogenase [Lactobacillus sp.]MCI2033577.1 homoserine dehydrogenase [Lactobacillus sp.]